MSRSLDVIFLGLSFTSSWGNGHATTYRGLLRELFARGHRVTFLERDVPWYARHRDLPTAPFADVALYAEVEELSERFAERLMRADAVIVGSYVPDGVRVAEIVLTCARGPVLFYDIDTPVTLRKLVRGDNEYIAPHLIPRFSAYLSFTGGPLLRFLERELGAKRALPLYCSFDPERYYPEPTPLTWDLGYLGTYSDDRQPTLERLLLAPARAMREWRFVVAGPSYPTDVDWPANVDRIEHLAPAEHRAFYAAQRFTLNVTRRDMIAAGYSPSVRLFEAAGCGVPLISDIWKGIETFFVPGEEILLAESSEAVMTLLRDVPEDERRKIGARAQERALAEHTAAHRAETLERYLVDLLGERARDRRRPVL